MGVRDDVDYRVYLVTSGADARTVAVAAAAARGGAGVVQVRLKDATAAERYDLLTQVADAVAEASPGARVLVDDDVDAARRAIGEGRPVHGVHLGHEDMPVRQARDLLGPDAIIGWTTGTLALVEKANEVADAIDYVGAGPFRPTPTKDSGRPALGLDGYPALVAVSRVPIVAIGDVRPGDVAGLAATGVAGVAMVRTIMEAANPEALVRRCRAAWS